VNLSWGVIVDKIVQVRGEFVTLSQALKVAGLTGSGGQAKQLIRAGDVTVNGEPESRPGRKLRSGDRFRVSGEEWTIKP